MVNLQQLMKFSNRTQLLLVLASGARTNLKVGVTGPAQVGGTDLAQSAQKNFSRVPPLFWL